MGKKELATVLGYRLTIIIQMSTILIVWTGAALTSLVKGGFHFVTICVVWLVGAGLGVLLIRLGRAGEDRVLGPTRGDEQAPDEPPA